MIARLLEILPVVQMLLAGVMVIRKRRELKLTLRRMPRWAAVGIALVMIACLVIPGPVDDLILAGLIARLTP